MHPGEPRAAAQEDRPLEGGCAVCTAAATPKRKNTAEAEQNLRTVAQYNTLNGITAWRRSSCHKEMATAKVTAQTSTNFFRRKGVLVRQASFFNDASSMKATKEQFLRGRQQLFLAKFVRVHRALSDAVHAQMPGESLGIFSLLKWGKEQMRCTLSKMTSFLDTQTFVTMCSVSLGFARLCCATAHLRFRQHFKLFGSAFDFLDQVDVETPPLPSNCYVAKSSLHGMGVFAASKSEGRITAPNVFISEYYGEIKGLALGWTPSVHAMRLHAAQDPLQINKLVGVSPHESLLFVEAETGSSDVRSTFPCRYLNHQNKPNAVAHVVNLIEDLHFNAAQADQLRLVGSEQLARAEHRTTVYQWESGADFIEAVGNHDPRYSIVTINAIRPIAADEEISLDYEHARRHVPADPGATREQVQGKGNFGLTRPCRRHRHLGLWALSNASLQR
jgi:hypothetical protein